MSKLPNAPLLEVIFELSWAANTPQEREKFQFLLGNMYAKLKDKYPHRQNLAQIGGGIEIPIDIFNNRPMYRFRKEENSYPLYQLGPGLLSINTIDSAYFWDDFEKEIRNIVDELKNFYDFNNITTINTALKFIDFYKFDFKSNNPFQFLKDNLHLSIENKVCDDNNPIFLTFAMGNKVELGQFNYITNRGVVNQKGEGFLVETNLVSKISSYEFDKIGDWINNAHEFLSNAFKNMTEGKLFDSFQ